MKKSSLFIFMLASVASASAQNFKTDQGDIKNISGIERYNIIFEYASDLKIPNYDSEEEFLEFQTKKREKKESGSGEKFKKLWFENRTNIYEPTFIQQFNIFNLKNKQVTVAKNITTTEYTMVVKTVMIHPGYDTLVLVEGAKLKVQIVIYKTDFPEDILYSTQTTIKGTADSNEYERLRDVYVKLGRAASKHFSRKT